MDDIGANRFVRLGQPVHDQGMDGEPRLPTGMDRRRFKFFRNLCDLFHGVSLLFYAQRRTTVAKTLLFRLFVDHVARNYAVCVPRRISRLVRCCTDPGVANEESSS